MKQQRGFSLLELLIVAAILSLLIGVFVSRNSERARVTSDAALFASDLVAWADRVRALSTGNDLVSVSIDDMAAQLLPEWRTSPTGGTQRHSLGGSLLFAKTPWQGINNAAVLIRTVSLTPEACVLAARQASRRFARVQINSTLNPVVKDVNSLNVNFDLIRQQCVNPSNTVFWFLAL